MSVIPSNRKRVVISGQAVIIDPQCNTCNAEVDGGNWFFPNHDSSLRCESGKRSHCTCDTCF